MVFMNPYWISRRAVIGAAVARAASLRFADGVVAQTKAGAVRFT
jgi:hypothetical protein